MIFINITKHLPPPPTGVGNYVIGYMPNLDTYRLGVTDYTGEIILNNNTLTTDGISSVVFGDRYELINDEWVHYTNSTGWISWYEDVSSLGEEEQGKLVAYSSNRIVTSTGSVLSLGGYEKNIEVNGITVVGDTLSSSSIKTTLLSPIINILPILIFFVICVMSFRKGWQFLRLQIQGV